MKIYVASSWRNEYQPQVVEALRQAGHEVYDFRHPSETDHGFSWSEIDPDWINWNNQQYMNALRHPIANRSFANDFNAMKWADACVLVMPCGRSAHTEAGWMAGAGKTVFVYQPDNAEPELMYKIFDYICPTMERLLLCINHEVAQIEVAAFKTQKQSNL